ncbi:hypothetical protein H257_00369 [Aphanomyces astaci]|uniref:Rab-GAP TBC domain-containing protein n=1 Tax=Aphanomyces astaci TaxID=112090 RepID=W4HCR0_APHAT|nr:hypothetical protein H257_00369 [Aphanomyces astaci]ETV88923.1 hypothetical protein H257_00369 [Aphanomyces astaci]|eukprot:XP_009821323.1 hypothetical protein H257_00369 [Aphanomyces astaci]
MAAATPASQPLRPRTFSVGSCTSTSSVFSVKRLNAEAMLIAGAAWVPDDAIDACMVCFVAFTAFRRKHHCRSCGALVCGGCSKGRMRIDGLDQRSRVCDVCQRTDVPHLTWQEWLWNIELLRANCQVSTWWSCVMKRRHMSFSTIPSLDDIERRYGQNATPTLGPNPSKLAQDLHQIHIDTDRTFNLPRHRSLPFDPRSTTKDSRKHALRRVLKAYATSNPSIGYCQGMDYVVAVLLFGSKWECSHAFRLLYVLMESFDLQGIYAPGLPLLNARFYQLDELVHTHLQDLHEHLVDHHMHPNAYATGWILTLFANCQALAPRVVLRFFDLFISKGWKSFFRVALALLSLAKRMLMLAHTTEALMAILHTSLHELVPESDTSIHSFFTLARSFKVTNTRLRSLEEQFCRTSNGGTFLDEDLMDLHHPICPT